MGRTRGVYYVVRYFEAFSRSSEGQEFVLAD